MGSFSFSTEKPLARPCLKGEIGRSGCLMYTKDLAEICRGSSKIIVEGNVTIFMSILKFLQKIDHYFRQIATAELNGNMSSKRTLKMSL